MLYTVTPLERIYGDRNISPEDNKIKSDTETEEDLKTISLSHGKVYVKRKGDNYIVDGILSTDMTDYLKKEYTPGEKYHMEE